MTGLVLVVGKTDIPYTVRESERARRKRIVVTPDGVLVVVPQGTASSETAAFMHAKRRWVFDKVSDMAARAAPSPSPATPWSNGSKVLWRGRKLTLRVATADVDEAIVVYRSRFEVGLPRTTTAQAQPEATRIAVEAWMKDRALREAKALVARFAARAGVTVRRVEVRPMARLWGSCGRDGVVRLDQGFMQLPAHLGEYLAAHEAVHLVHRDHSAKFWRLLRTLLPDARARHEELVGHGRGL